MDELRRDLASSDDSMVIRALLDAANFAPATFAQDAALTTLESEHEGRHQAALVALAVLARAGELERTDRLSNAIDRALSDPLIAGTAGDLMDDIKAFDEAHRQP